MEESRLNFCLKGKERLNVILNNDVYKKVELVLSGKIIFATFATFSLWPHLISPQWFSGQGKSLSALSDLGFYSVYIVYYIASQKFFPCWLLGQLANLVLFLWKEAWWLDVCGVVESDGLPSYVCEAWVGWFWIDYLYPLTIDYSLVFWELENRQNPTYSRC